MSAPASASGVPPAAYEPGAARDEAFLPDGTPRPLYEPLLAALAERDLEAAGRAAAAAAEDAGVSFGAGDAQRPFHVDPVPRLIGADEWAATAAGLAQRARALAAFLADVYGERRIVAAGVVPERVIESAAYHEPDAGGIEQDPAGFFAGLDLVRGDDGELRVLEDNARTPSGVGYATGARRAVDRALGEVAPAARLEAAGVLPAPGVGAAALRPGRRHRPVRGHGLRRAVEQRLVRALRAGRPHEPAAGHPGGPQHPRRPAARRRRGRSSPGPSTWSTGGPTRTACATGTAGRPGCTSCSCRGCARAR